MQLGPFDRIVVATGQRPDLDMTRELRLDLDPWLELPKALGPAIDPNLHSCGSVPPHGYKELSHPEPGYFAVGVKSYGRAPTFLMATGYEQVRPSRRTSRAILLPPTPCSLCCPKPAFARPTSRLRDQQRTAAAVPRPRSDACCVNDATAKGGGKYGWARLKPAEQRHAQWLIEPTTCCFSAPAIRRARSSPKRS